MERTARKFTRRAFAAANLAGLAALGLPLRALAQAPGAGEQANIALVNAFCAAWGRSDMTTIADSLADNCTFRVTQERPPIVGKKAVVEAIQGFLKRPIEFKVLKSVAFGPIVVNQRDDVIGAAGAQPARTIHIVAGVFYVVNGKIAEWTDFTV